MSELFVGAGGWAYFQVPGSDSLAAYSQAFNFVEVNSSYYELPSIGAASAWRKRVPADFRFAVRCPRILVDHFGLKLAAGTRILLERLEEICATLDADIMTVLIRADSPIGHEELADRLASFLDAFRVGETLVAVELRNVKLSGDLADVIKDSGAIHSVDISKEDPGFERGTLYSRLFGKGEENIYEFDDKELREITSKASQPKFERSILAFHGVRMYRDAGRVKSFIDKGYFPKLTSSSGLDSVREVLSEDAKFPTSKTTLLKDHGWKVYQDTDEVRRISAVLEKLPEGPYQSLDEVMMRIPET